VKITQLHINHFGHFSDRDIVFSESDVPSDAGLQVIYGPNEAGKTTLLEFLRCWLFDFPVRTPYDFKAGCEIAGRGTLILSDGRTLELRRRKGNKNKVGIKLDGRDTALDEAGFQRLIGHANRNLFESVFAFGLDQLSAGEESLKHESLQSALFGGGLGSTASPERIAQELDRQAAEIFNPGARKPAINQLLAELKELAARIKDKSLRSADYSAARDAVDAADARAIEIRRQVEATRQDHARADKLARAWPKWQELKQQTARRVGLSVPDGLPSDAAERHKSIGQLLCDAEEQRERLAGDIRDGERDLAAVRLDPQSVSLRAEIKAALALRQSTIDARRDLPERLRKRLATIAEIDRELNELRPGWGADDLKAFAIDVGTRAAIDRLASEEVSIATDSAKLRTRREALDDDLAQAQADLVVLGEPIDAAPLVAILAGRAAYSADCQARERMQAELARIERQLAASTARLAPPLPTDSTSSADLPVPRVETVAEFADAFGKLAHQMRAAADSLDDDLARQAELEAQLTKAAAQNTVPTLADRDARRSRRDAGWDLIRRRHIDGAPAAAEEAAWIGDAAGSLPAAYERAVREADEIADQIYAHADRVAARDALQRDCQAIARRIMHKQHGLNRLKQEQAGLHDRWQALWQPCGFEPLAPEAMRSWLADHQTVVETALRRTDATAELDRLALRIAAFETRLHAACGRDDADAGVLLVAAETTVDAARQHERRSSELRQIIERLKPRRSDCHDEASRLDERETTRRSEWQALLTLLNLPADWSAELARAVIERLSATRVKLDSLPHEDARIGAMQARIDEFESRVRPLCQRLAPELLRDPPELALEKLSDGLDQATEAQRRYDQIEKQLAVSRPQLVRVEERRTALLAEQATLFAAAQADSRDEFLKVVERAELIRTLDARIQQLASEIELIRASDDPRAFEQSLELAEPAELDRRRDRLAEQLATGEQQLREADGAAAVGRSELARLDGSGEAAVLTEQLARRRAQLAAEVDRYVPIVLAQHLLAESVRRFERENQPEMIKAVSHLIHRMTAGRYVEFDRTGGDRKEIVLRRSDGVERTPSQLSTGTREQLYLAIRLAYVLHYCRQNEPLPIVMDDVLVNFDDARAAQTLAVLDEIAHDVQVLFFTCHPHMVALAEQVVPGLRAVELEALQSQTTRA